MTWLYSLYMLGALAVAGPVLFHMWRRTPRGERPFSTLMFLTPSPPRLTSRSRVEHWMLLLLRATALALLALAFMRPLWRTAASEPDRSADERLIAILVDTSASMRRLGLWDDMVKQLDERIAKLPEQALVALYRFDRDFAAVADFHELKQLEPGARRSLVRARLKELKPSWEATRLGEALVRTATALQEAQTERATPAAQQIWLASDLQSGAETIALQGYEWPGDLPVEVIFAKSLSPSNAGLQVVEKDVDSADLLLRVRVTNAADSTKENFSLRWDTPLSPDISVYVPPGQSRVLVPPALPEGVSATSLVLSGDDHEFDNRVYVAETLREKRLIVYCGLEQSGDTDGARYYLERVFASSPRLDITLKDWREAQLGTDGQEPALLVLIQPEPECRPLIQNTLEKGGTVIIASPSAEALSTSLVLCGRDDLKITEASVSRYAMLGEIDFEHRVFAPFAEAQFSDFTGIRFWKHRTSSGWKTKSAASDAGAANTDQILARFDDGDPAVVEFPVSRGQVIVLASGWHPADSQFARSSKFPMLMFRLLELSTGITPRSGVQTVGGELTWPQSNLVEISATGTAVLPDGTELSGLPTDRPFAQTARPGLYKVTASGRTEQIAVNLAADESRTAPMSLEQLDSYGLKLKAHERPQEQQHRRERERQLQLVELEQSQKLWQTILMAIFVLLICETLLGGILGSCNAQAFSASN